MLLFVLVNAYFQPRGERRALALFLVTYLLVTSLTETGLSDASVYLLELALAASLLVPRPRGPGGRWMKILLVHNRYRSAAPSGENRVVDQEGEALAAAGHEVIRFEQHSDEIEHWSAAKKASLPARTVWSRRVPPRPGRGRCASTSPTWCTCTTRFPCSARLSCTRAGPRRSRSWPPCTTTSSRCASGDFFRHGAVCHDCAHGLPVPAVLHGCYRGSRAGHRAGGAGQRPCTGRRGGRWCPPTCSSRRLSATCSAASACPRTGSSSGTT